MRKNKLTKASMARMINAKAFSTNQYCKVCGGSFVAATKDEHGFNVIPEQEKIEGVHTGCMAKYLQSKKSKEKEEEFDMNSYMSQHKRK